MEEMNIGADVASANNVVLAVTGDTLGEAGFDTNLTLTRHGNTGASSDPQIHRSQLGRQQSWVLSTTDQRLSFFWHVDAPIIRDDNYALCLGMLPDLANLPSTRNPEMPSLYINTLFYSHEHRIAWPAKVVKEDRRLWTATPTAIYTGAPGTYTPDGTLPQESPYSIGIAVETGDEISEPYHFRSLPRATFLSYRLSGLHDRLTDAELLEKILVEWTEEADLETSRAWNGCKLWECLADGTDEQPLLGCTDWVVVSGNLLWTIDFQSSNGSSFYQGHVSTVVTARLMWGDDDVTDRVPKSAFVWTRSSESGKTDADRAWDEAMSGGKKIHQGTNVLSLTDDDMPTAWSRNNKAIFICTVTYDGEVVAENKVIA